VLGWLKGKLMATKIPKSKFTALPNSLKYMLVLLLIHVNMNFGRI